MSLDDLPFRLLQARQSRGFTQAALRAEARIPHVMMISGWERGLYLPRADYLVAVARALGVTLDWLCGLSERGGPGRRGPRTQQRVSDSNTPGAKPPGKHRKHGRKRQAIAGSKRGRVR